jgi:hypothetical protein
MNNIKDNIVICNSCGWIGNLGQTKKTEQTNEIINDAASRIIKQNSFVLVNVYELCLCPKCQSNRLYTNRSASFTDTSINVHTSPDFESGTYTVGSPTVDDCQILSHLNNNEKQNELDTDDGMIDVIDSVLTNAQEVKPSVDNSHFISNLNNRPPAQDVFVKCDRCGVQFKVAERVVRKCSIGNSMRCLDCMKLLNIG